MVTEEQGRLPNETVILVDTLGELQTIYSIADCVFVGKSLVPQRRSERYGACGTGKTNYRWPTYV